MRLFKTMLPPLFATTVLCVASASAWAQQVRILYPQEGQDVRGEITVRYEGLPPGGYAIIKVDGQFKQASAQDFATFDTITDRSTFTRGDAGYKLEITVLRPGGAQVGTDSVTFNVANNKVDAGGESVKLVHWKPSDVLRDYVDRYRVFAESNAVIEDGKDAGGGGSSGGSSGGGGRGGSSGGSGGGGDTIDAPLDWEVSALMRRQVRNVGMYNGSANIASTVQESFERQRESDSGGGGGGGGGGGSAKASTGPPAKAPWGQWSDGSETGKFFVKMIEPNGTEINPTRKAPTIAIADLLPTFPDAPVRPGSTWETNMTILSDLSTRKGLNVTAPITFTAYDTIVTPGGESRRAAKMESRFRLPDNLAKQIAADLADKIGTTSNSGGAGGEGGSSSGGSEGGRGGSRGGSSGGSSRGGSSGGSGGGAAAEKLTPADFKVARTDVSRVLWFDIERRQILRSEDTMKSYFEIPATDNAAGGSAGGGASSRSSGSSGGSSRGGSGSSRGGSGSSSSRGGDGESGADNTAPAEPTKVNYDVGVTTWFDDRVPAPTRQYNGGAGTAHSKDSVKDIGIDRANKITQR